jgi:hypothetical protein
VSQETAHELDKRQIAFLDKLPTNPKKVINNPLALGALVGESDLGAEGFAQRKRGEITKRASSAAKWSVRRAAWHHRVTVTRTESIREIDEALDDDVEPPEFRQLDRTSVHVVIAGSIFGVEYFALETALKAWQSVLGNAVQPVAASAALLLTATTLVLGRGLFEAWRAGTRASRTAWSIASAAFAVLSIVSLIALGIGRERGLDSMDLFNAARVAAQEAQSLADDEQSSNDEGAGLGVDRAVSPEVKAKQQEAQTLADQARDKRSFGFLIFLQVTGLFSGGGIAAFHEAGGLARKVRRRARLAGSAVKHEESANRYRADARRRVVTAISTATIETGSFGIGAAVAGNDDFELPELPEVDEVMAVLFGNVAWATDTESDADADGDLSVVA